MFWQNVHFKVKSYQISILEGQKHFGVKKKNFFLRKIYVQRSKIGFPAKIGQYVNGVLTFERNHILDTILQCFLQCFGILNFGA